MSSFSNGHGAQERRGAGRAVHGHRAAHIGLCSGFINEDKMLRLQMRLQGTPLFACLGDIGTVLFGGAQRLFLSVSPR